MIRDGSKIISIARAYGFFPLMLAVGFALGTNDAELSLQQGDSIPNAVPNLVESGRVTIDGHSVPYRIRRLPVSSFPDLPQAVAEKLTQRGCMIPQTYQAHRPENVIHASLEHAGSSDWAVLCGTQGRVTLLVFFGGRAGEPVTLTSVTETDRLQPRNGTGLLGFDWGIDSASPQAVRQAQAGLDPRPSMVDHDALADTVIDHRTTYRFYAKGGWTTLDMPE